MYYIAETNANDSGINNANTWKATGAKTLAGAKRAASNAQMFQGTTLWVGKEVHGQVVEVAVKRHDALDMRKSDTWADI